MFDEDRDFCVHNSYSSFSFYYLTVAESLSVEEPSTSSVSSSPSKDGKPHPTNPNHVKLSHFTVLAGGGQKGSWSIEKPKKNSHDIQDSLKGKVSEPPACSCLFTVPKFCIWQRFKGHQYFLPTLGQ